MPALALVGLMFVGCQTYREQFVYFSPNGKTNHVVNVGFSSCLMFGSAARLKTETQTGEFIRNVNADGVVLKPDAESVKAITEGVSAAVLKVVKPVP
jgi:hypothetical protein